MKGDFTRSTFHKEKHFKSVRMQQGRVQIDADSNEQADIVAHREETANRDALGECAAPLQPVGDFANFQIKATANGRDFNIAPGRIYVDGILCENDEVLTGTGQANLSKAELVTQVKGNNRKDVALNKAAKGSYVAYMVVQERHVTALEDPSIREVALGGPDTATRTEVAWQVRLLQVEAATTCASELPAWLTEPPTGKMQAQTEPGDPDEGPCDIPESGGYQRLQNQLYRVEVHEGGARASATFKWSRDNGAVVATWLEDDGSTLPKQVRVGSLGRDEAQGFAAGQWVELTDDTHELLGKPGTLAIIQDPPQGRVLNLDRDVDRADFPDNPKVRRWDMTEEATGALPMKGAWTALEGGVQVKFAAGDYRTGDYWLIPARTLEKKIEWPREGGDPQKMAPHGRDLHFCSLALITIERTSGLSAVPVRPVRGARVSLAVPIGLVAEIKTVTDCRPLFPPATELTSLFYVSGDGQEAVPGEPGPYTVLPSELQVGVANGSWPVEGARVRFKRVTGVGRLQGNAADVILETGADGTASCQWHMDTHRDAPEVQQVEAWLLDPDDVELHVPIRFTATRRDSVLFYVSGDGQEAVPGEPGPYTALPGELQVGVANGRWPVLGAKVHFKRVTGAGRLQGNDADVILQTGADGMVSCQWEPDTQRGAEAVQWVKAWLLDADDNEVHVPIKFTATRRESVLFYVSGDGQEAVRGVPGPHTAVPNDLQVGVANGRWPVESARVRFELVGGAGNLPDVGADGVIETGPDGIARCPWTLDTSADVPPVQRVQARLLRGPNDDDAHIPILFTATVGPDAIHIDGVETISSPKRAILNDRPIPIASLVGGLVVECDKDVNPAMVKPPTCFITLELPFPLVGIERAIFGISDVAGFRPIILDGDPGVDGNKISWTPRPGAAALLGRLSDLMGSGGAAGPKAASLLHTSSISAGDAERIDRVDTIEMAVPESPTIDPVPGMPELPDKILARLTIKGRFISEKNDRTVWLDGTTYGLPDGDGIIDRRTPSGDGVRGGDFEMWFWLFEPPHASRPDAVTKTTATKTTKKTTAKRTTAKRTTKKTTVKKTTAKRTTAKRTTKKTTVKKTTAKRTTAATLGSTAGTVALADDELAIVDNENF